MSVRPHQDNQAILRNFIPLNTLPSAHFSTICDECHIEECDKGVVLFEQGDETKEFIYLISGMISLFAGEMEMETIVTGSEVARFAIAHQLPRKVRAVTKSKARILRVPTYMLDIDNPGEDEQTYLVDEVGDHGGDWMTTMLQSPVFQRLPASNLQKVMMQMEEVTFSPGDVVVKQGDEADFYYIIKSGSCELIRQPAEGARLIKLGELHSCDAFGEDALLSGNPRNVTVQMKGKGQMLRLSKANFIKLVKEPVLQYVNFQEGQGKVSAGANWLDVRGVDEYVDDHIEGSVNIPFFSLRMKIAELRHDQLQVLVCSNGRTSEAAAFLLLKFGFNALILKGGIASKHTSKSKQKASELSLKEVPLSAVATASNVSQGATVSNADGLNTKQLEEAQRKIAELEKLCAQSNERSNKLELERRGLQQQYEQQAALVAELQLSSKRVSDELLALRNGHGDREVEMSQALLAEKEAGLRLSKELEDKALALDKAQQAMESSRELLSLLGEDIKAKDKELDELKRTISDVNTREAETTTTFKETLAMAKQEAIELRNQKKALEEKVEATEREMGALLKSQTKLEEENKQRISDKEAANLEKDNQIQQLNSQLSEMRSTIKSSGQLQTQLENQLSQTRHELEQLKEKQNDAIEKNKAEADARRQELESDINALTQQVEEKDTALEKQTEALDVLAETCESLKEKSRRYDQTLHEKTTKLEALTKALETAEKKLEAFSQEREDLESAVLEKDTLLAEWREQSVAMNAEEAALEEKLAQSDSHLSNVLAEKTVLAEQLNELRELTDELKSNEDNYLTEVDSLKQQKSQAEKALAESLNESEARTEQFEKEAIKLRQQVIALESSLSEISSGKESLENELKKRLAEAQNDAKVALTTQQDVEQQLNREVSEKEAIQKSLIALEKQLAQRQGEQQQLSKQLDESQEKLEELHEGGEAEVLRLTKLLQQAESKLQERNVEFNSLAKEKEGDVRQLQQKADMLEAELEMLQRAEAENAQELNKLASEKEAADQASLVAKSQLDSLLIEQQKVTAELSQVRQETKIILEEKEAKNAKLAGSLEQFKGQLVSVQTEKDELQQKFLDAEAVLSDATGDQRELLVQLEKARDESVELTRMVELKQVEMDEFVALKKELEEELLTSKEVHKTMGVLVDSSEQRCDELTKTLALQASEQQDKESVFEERLKGLERQLQQTEMDLQAERVDLKEAKASLSSSVSEKEKMQVALDELEQLKLSGDKVVNVSQQKMAELEQSLKSLKVEKEQLIEAHNDADEKTAQLTEQLLTAQNAEKETLKRLDQLMSSLETDKHEKAALEEKLADINNNNNELKHQLEKMERNASSAVESDPAEKRIKELEKQLDEASTMLLDLEIKLETSSSDVVEEPSEEEKNALKALQSELDLVREQTEKDIQAMQLKVENSEKMNLALKKKILTMQTLANQEVLPEKTQKEKKKGWWK
jgi:CRP-like cAMP-binding protein/chromosome segregation ATPase/rhodanese-related sulfurtransferase